MIDENSFDRFELLTGASAASRLRSIGVILFGVGGVGSWCAEALVRSGVTRLTIVDFDTICCTNINRQLQATTTTIGRAKVDVLAARLNDINPKATITTLRELYRRDFASLFNLDKYDYVLDAIDSLSAKVDLIMSATEAGATVFTSLGAASRIDPSRIKTGSLWNSEGCRLGRMVRKRLRRRKFQGNPLCVYSEELPIVHTEGEEEFDDEDNDLPNGDSLLCSSDDSDQLTPKETTAEINRRNGSAVHVTGTFGFFLAGLVIQDVMKRTSRSTGVAIDR